MREILCVCVCVCVRHTHTQFFSSHHLTIKQNVGTHALTLI